MQLVNARSVSPLGKREMEDNIPPEDLDTESSSDDVISPQVVMICCEFFPWNYIFTRQHHNGFTYSAIERLHQHNAQNLGLIIPESVQKAMSDKFQEAFGAASANEEGLHLPLHG